MDNLYSQLKEITSEQYEVSSDVYLNKIIKKIKCLEKKDSYTIEHSEKVCFLSQKISELLHLDKNKKELVFLASLLHDIGKIKIPNNILKSNQKLTDEERTIIQTHSFSGAKIIKKIGGSDTICSIILNHHERFDGDGYPNKLKSSNIPLESRIIAISDSIDAMLSDRCYRPKLSSEQCYNEIEKNLNKMYDPEIGNIVLNNWDKCIAF